ncbi:Bacteriocin class II with double-glycine leader peptide [compost metagenome]
MRDLSEKELSQISGGDKGDTFFENVGATLGGALGAAIGSRTPIGATGGAAVGSGLGAIGGGAAYNAVKDAANAWDPSGFSGTSFFPQTNGS